MNNGFNHNSIYFWAFNSSTMKHIAILCGGFSSEFEISKKSATTILNNFPEGYFPFLVEVTKESWTALISNQRVDYNPWEQSYVYEGQKRQIDAAIIYIHGNPGENGKIQAILEMQEIPYVNSGALASELSFDKWYCNQFLKGFDKKIDLLFLDSFDYWGDEENIKACHNHSLNELKAAWDKLNEHCFVLIDDVGGQVA